MSTPVTLAIETATNACSVALSIENELEQKYVEGNNVHSQKLLAMVDELMAGASCSLSDIELIAVGVGPGSFTGLRIGVGVAQGLAYSHDLPVCAVSSLQALALSSAEQLPAVSAFMVGLDARMSEIYIGDFVRSSKSANVVLSNDYRVLKPENIMLDDKILSSDIAFVGNAWSVYKARFSDIVLRGMKAGHIVEEFPQAHYIAQQAMLDYAAGKAIDCKDLKPHYVRNDVAKKSLKNPLLGSGV
ncbi:MAG: tRNA (adenosine(37)-N6)-threonylcarbamoyltransferase complex dimerization subunit type 1 TsaB [Arenicella sp.]